MVDWDRVQTLRGKGWDWADIASDPDVDFHPTEGAGNPGRQLRALYHRTGRRVEASNVAAAAPKREGKEVTERKWTLARIGYLLAPALGVWFLLAYVAPSPVGTFVPAIPYLALAFAAAAFVLIYALWRSTGSRRWTPAYRTAVVGGIVVGLVVAGGAGLVGTVVFGCPYLPPSSSLSPISDSGWSHGSIRAWTSGGKPVLYFYGATWCPYCSASSWALWKALSEYGTVSGTSLDYSNLSDTYGGTPEIVVANLGLGPKNGHAAAVDFQVSEDTSGVRDTYPTAANCYQQAYITAYSAGIPFYVLNGQYVHAGSLINPPTLSIWNYYNKTSNGGAQTVETSVSTESGVSSGNPWAQVQTSAWWMMALIAKVLGTSPSTLASDYGWSSGTLSHVWSDLNDTS